MIVIFGPKDVTKWEEGRSSATHMVLEDMVMGNVGTPSSSIRSTVPTPLL